MKRRLKRLWGRRSRVDPPDYPYVSVQDAFEAHQKVLRQNYLLIRSNYGDVIAWPKGKDRPWSAWRYAQGSPEHLWFSDITYKHAEPHHRMFPLHELGPNVVEHPRHAEPDDGVAA